MQDQRDVQEKDIRTVCGLSSFYEGQALIQNGTRIEVTNGEGTSLFRATIPLRMPVDVQVDLQDPLSISALCSCSNFEDDDFYCAHIAAVLLKIMKNHYTTQPQLNKMVSTWEKQLSTSVLSILERTSVEPTYILTALPTAAKTIEPPLEIEFICKTAPHANNSSALHMELKVGPKKTYVVQKAKEWLEAVEHKKAFLFAKNFTYNPAVHHFKSQDWNVLELLIEAKNSESAYREALGLMYSGYAGGRNDQRSMYVPPHIWDKLVPVLTEEVNVAFEHGLVSHPKLEIIQGAPPIRAELSKPASSYYQLDFHNLDKIEVLEKYGYALLEGKLHKLKPAQLRRIAELKSSLSRTNQLRITPEELEPVMSKTIRGLKTVANVTMAKQITERIVDVPLRGKLYLDRIGDMLIAGLEYVYGDITINPLEPDREFTSTLNRILMRDTDRERQLMAMMEAAGFQRDEGRLWLTDEDAVYEFLFHTLPLLEKEMEVFATSAFKPYAAKHAATPKISVDWDEKTHWLEVKFDMAGVEKTDIRQILRSVVEKRRYVRLQDGAYLSLQEEHFRELERLMHQLHVRKSEIKGPRLMLSVARGFPLLNEADMSRMLQLGKSFRQLLSNLRNPDHLDFPVPPQLEQTMRGYQKYGYQWLKTLAHYRFGGILADDMGLGKTLQSIAYIVSELDTIRSNKVPALIVCPASLLYNWRNEIIKFAPMLRAEVIAGPRRGRAELMNELAEHDVLITSYPLLRRDLDLYEGVLFHSLFLDEAQMIKNHNTQTAQAVKELQAQQRFALTGTPVENSLEELWSIFDAVFPELFEDRRSFQDLLREDVAKRVRPFILRRMKQDVLQELPDKIETLQTSELTSEQKELYLTYLAKLKKETAVQLTREGFQKSRMRILAGLTRLRQLCCHPSLFIDNYEGQSGKLEQLKDIVEEALGSGKRILLFSQFTGMLAIIRQALEERGESCFYLDGSTPAKERVELCRRFNEGEQDLFLISLKAGGTGLNLTGADTVILYDLWWNPAVEQQATDRAHRIGQTKVVQVIRMITQGTVEEKMHELQQKKKDLIDQVIQPGEEAISSLSEEDLREILNM